MRILWFNSGLLAPACKACGYECRMTCGWLEAMLQTLQRVDVSLEFCVLCLDARPCDVQIGSTRYVSFGGSGAKLTYREVPSGLQRQVHRVISEFNPDVIHVHGTESFFGNMRSEVYGGKPVVVSLQGIISACWIHLSGGLTPLETLVTDIRPRLFLKCQSIWLDQQYWRNSRAQQEQSVFKRQKYFIGRTNWDRDCLKYYAPSAEYFPVNETLRAPFYNFRRVDNEVRRHSIYCGGAASYPLKGVHWLMRAIAVLVHEFPDIQLRIAAAQDVLSGSHSMKGWLRSFSYHHYLRRLVKELRIERNIVALPALSAEEVGGELCKAELFVLPSLCENSSNSLGEAMLVGTPSIAMCAGGVPDIMCSGKEGVLVPPADPYALSGAIRHWFLHPEEAEACADAARATALKRHDALANARATLAVYRELAAR